MDPLRLPSSGTVYVDANCVIYSVERIEPYDALLMPLWQAAAESRLSIVTSELTLLEVLVRPIRDQNEMLMSAFRAFLTGTRELSMIPVTTTILEQAAHIRAETGMRTPDAIHAATAIETQASLFVTNDPGLRRVSVLGVSVLSELTTA